MRRGELTKRESLQEASLFSVRNVDRNSDGGREIRPEKEK